MKEGEQVLKLRNFAAKPQFPAGWPRWAFGRSPRLIAGACPARGGGVGAHRGNGGSETEISNPSQRTGGMGRKERENEETKMVTSHTHHHCIVVSADTTQALSVQTHGALLEVMPAVVCTRTQAWEKATIQPDGFTAPSV